MININWTKEIDDTIYRMEFVRIVDKNYLVKFSATPLDAVEDVLSSSSCLVELSSHEIGLCNVHPKDTYEFIKYYEEGYICYAIDFCHDRSSDPEYKCISRDIHTVYSMDRYINRLCGYPIEHDLNGCVVNRESCVVHTNYFAKNEKAVFDFVENIYDQTVNDIRLWESENCPKLTNEADDWNPKTWNSLMNFYGGGVWSDGENMYYSENTDQYILNKSTSTWIPKTWTGLSSIDGWYIWTDGEDVYYSDYDDHYVLNKDTSTWIEKTWKGLTYFTGSCIWTDGERIYHSYQSKQYVLDKDTSTWIEKTWNGLTELNGDCIWSDGENVFYSNGSFQYILDKTTSTWIEKTWNGLRIFYGCFIWTKGDEIYYSNGPDQYILDKSTSTWIPKTWSGLKQFYGNNVWTNEENMYYSYGSNQYMLSGENE